MARQERLECSFKITRINPMLGACATAGGIQAIRNWFDHDEIRAAVEAGYGDDDFMALFPHLRSASRSRPSCRRCARPWRSRRRCRA